MQKGTKVNFVPPKTAFLAKFRRFGVERNNSHQTPIKNDIHYLIINFYN